MKKIYDYLSGNTVLIKLILILIVIIGIFSTMNLKREVFPETETDTMRVDVSYPGASPIDVETNVIIPLEDKIKKIIGIKEYVSISMENSARMFVYLHDKLKNAKEVKDEIIRELSNVSELPEDVEKIEVININPKRMSVYTFGISIKDTSKTSIKELYDLYDTLEQKLKKLSGISEIKGEGYLDPEISIKVNPLLIKKYNLSLNSIISSIKSRNIRSTGGTIQSITKGQNIVTIGQFDSPLDVKDVVIRANYEGNRIYIKDIADVNMEFKEKNIEVFINREPGLTVSISKNEDADISKTIQSVKDLLEKNKADYEKKFNITTIDDRSLSITALLNVVESNAIFGFFIVFIILIIFLDFRSAFWTAMGIPTAILVTFIFMYHTDMSLNIISLAAIITVIGMLVDDAIVISENIYYHKLKGLPLHEAGYKGVTEVTGPVIMSVLTTVVAFLPLLAIKGKMGLFIYVFPIVVSIALIASLFEAIFLLPHHMTHGKINTINKSGNWFDPVMELYKKALMSLLKLRYLVVLFFITVLIITVVLSANIFKKFILIQDNTSDSFMINLEAPIGTNLAAATEMTKNFEKIINQQINKDNIIAVKTVIGHHRVKIITDRGNREDWAQISFFLTPVSERKEKVEDIIKELNQFIKAEGKFGFDKIFFDKKVMGPDPGKGVEVKLAGSKLEIIGKAVNELKEYISSINGVSGIDTTNKPGKEEIVINFDHHEMARLNLDVETVARTIKTAYDGVIVTTFQTETKKIDFRLELEKDFKRDIKFLKTLLIPNKQGRLIELSDISSFSVRPGVSYIDHYNGDRAVIITANVNNQITTSKIAMEQIKNQFDKMAKNYPGVYMIGGGEAQETASSLNDLYFAFILALLAIYTILIIQFKDPVQPFIILSLIPFGLIGAILAFIIHGVPLSFMGMIGLIGLSGIVVNDSIVMVDFINVLVKDKKDKKNIDYKTLIADGAKRRLRPIILTTVTTVGGLLPTVYGIGGKVESIIPTSMAIAYGLLFSTLVTLVFLPSLYLIIIDIKSINFKKEIKFKNKTINIVPMIITLIIMIFVIIAGFIAFNNIRNKDTSINKTETKAVIENKNTDEIKTKILNADEIKGTMTLKEVSDTYKVDLSKLFDKMKISKNNIPETTALKDLKTVFEKEGKTFDIQEFRNTVKELMK